MVTFNVDSLDFSDGEAIRTGADDDFSTRYSSSNDRLEIEDLTNATVGHVPRGTSTDLVGGKFAETLSEGEALADNGQVYDSIQAAVDNASSWVKVGPGRFTEPIAITTSGLTIEGSGYRTHIDTSEDGIDAVVVETNVGDVTLSNFSVSTPMTGGGNGQGGVRFSGGNGTAFNITVRQCGDRAFRSVAPNVVIHSCTVETSQTHGIITKGVENIAVNCNISNILDFEGILNIADDVVTAYNTVQNTGSVGISQTDTNDSITLGNIVRDTGGRGIQINAGGTDNIVANNRLINTGGVSDGGTGTVLDANLTT